MSSVIIGSKFLSGWFEGDDPEYWEITNMLDAMQKSIIANVVMQTQVTIQQAEKLQNLNEPLVWAYRELLGLKNEIIEMKK